MGNKALEMLKKIPETKVDVVEKCAGHGGTFGVMKKTRKSQLNTAGQLLVKFETKKTSIWSPIVHSLANT